jgi:hypothetical protein
LHEVVVRIVPCERPYRVDPLAPRQHEQRRGIGHFRDVIAVLEELGGAGKTIAVAWLHAVI